MQQQNKLMEAMWDSAARSGMLTVIINLHIEDFPGCTSNTMDYAVMSGNLNIVHFLFHHKKQICSTKAMNTACMYGHIKIVKFLYRYLFKYCNIEEAKAIAITNGYTKIVSFLENK